MRGLGDSPVGGHHSGMPLSANHVALQKRHKTANFLTKALLIVKMWRGLIYLYHAFLDELDQVCYYGVVCSGQEAFLSCKGPYLQSNAHQPPAS